MALVSLQNQDTDMGLNRLNNYQTRLFIMFAVFTWIITIAFFAVQYTREREYKVDILNARMQEINARVIGDIKDGKALDKKYVSGLCDDDSIRLSLIDRNGNVIYDSCSDSIKVNHRNRQEVVEALNTGSGCTIRRQSETNDKDYFYSATLADSIIVRTALPYNDELQSMLDINTIYGYFIALVSCILTVIAFFASGRISLNVKMLRDFANSAEKGDISDFSTAKFPKDELGEISVHIVNMYKNLKRTTEERDKHLKEAMHEESEKNRIKQQLTNNINHELKTPVHAIQACLETVVNNGDKLPENMVKELTEKSYQNVKRLSALLSDVSILTRMNDAPEKIGVDEINLKTLADMLISDLILAYPVMKTFTRYICIPDNVLVHGNVALLESIFKNLIVNTLLHSGGNEIHINCYDSHDGYVHITYWDNGKGVSKEHLNKIFERFYRVDEGRARANGGTGLGLSIVRNAVAFHGGTIEASNRKQGGLQFNFTLRE